MLGSGYLRIDIDKVTEDMTEYFKDNNANSMTADFLRNISTYAEFSPSRTRLHFIGKGKVPGIRKRYKNLEIYDKDRFFTVTGNIIKDKERNRIAEIESELKPLYEKYMPKSQEICKGNSAKRNIAQFISSSDNEILHKIFERGYFSYSGENLKQIYSGNYQPYFSSQSEADFFYVTKAHILHSGYKSSSITYDVKRT